MTDPLLWLHAHPTVSLLLFFVATGLVTEVFRKRTPTEEVQFRATQPRLFGLRELLRGAGWDGPKIRGGLALLLLGNGRSQQPSIVDLLEGPTPTPRDPGLYPPPGQASGPDDDPRGASADPERTPRP